MQFGLRMINYACSCDTPAENFRIGVSSAGELVAVWNCAVCEHLVMHRIPLERLITDIPPIPVQSTPPSSPYNEGDRALLAQMKISIGESDE